MQSSEWKHFQDIFNKSKDVFIFGHGGNMGEDYAIDITRLTEKWLLREKEFLLHQLYQMNLWNLVGAKWLEFRSRGKSYPIV